jgi:uncharacterized protein YjdB
MKRTTIILALVSLLLSIAAAGFNGCGKGNTLTSISITPAEPFIVKDTTLQLSVTAHFSDGMTLSSWTQITWQSSDPEVATVSGAGLVKAFKVGKADITAVDKAHPEITASVTAIITDLESITILPLSATISAGTWTQFTATGAYTTISLLTSTLAPTVLTALVSWATSSTDIAVISNVTGSNGVATAVSAGTVTITATYPTTTKAGTATLITVPTITVP